VLKDLARDARDYARAGVRAIESRIELARRGESSVSNTCQIPGIRQKYIELGLSAKSGVFVEVGAFDGESYSNTSFLADQGWRGLYVEPIGKYYSRMRLRHALNNVAGERVAVAETAGTAQIEMMGPLTTLNIATAEHYEGVTVLAPVALKRKAVTIRTESLETILKKNSIPEHFDLMIIDVEGAEEPIVESLIHSAWRPKVLVLELCDKHPSFADNAALADPARRMRRMLISAGYRERYADQLNTIFVFQ